MPITELHVITESSNAHGSLTPFDRIRRLPDVSRASLYMAATMCMFGSDGWQAWQKILTCRAWTLWMIRPCPLLRKTKPCGSGFLPDKQVK